MLQEMPELLAKLGAARFAGQQNAPTILSQALGKPLNLRGFAAAFAAFK